MSRIRNVNTNPELNVREIVSALGYRYRLHAKELPGHPDIVFRKRRMVLFVNGCFWHLHGCRQYRMPKTNRRFWESKLAKNRIRDRRVQRELRKLGWRSLVVWECQLRDPADLRKRVKIYLEQD